MPGPDVSRGDELVAYLRERGHIGAGERPETATLAGGVSNRTVLVRRETGEAWVIKQALAKLNVAVDWFADPARVHREAEALRWLGRLLPAGAVPRLVFEDEAAHIVAMEAVPEPHANWKEMLLAGELDRAHVAAFAALLGDIHRAGRERAAELAPLFADRSFFESLRLEPYYLYAGDREPVAAPFLRALVEETHGVRETLVHGDFSPKNVLVRGGRLVLLDHEVMHFGDGAFDVGFALTHLLAKANHVRGQRAAFLEAARLFWTAYTERAQAPGPPGAWERRAVRHTVACLLARVAGRSPLEYLGPGERARQREAALALMAQPPARIEELGDAFAARTLDPAHADGNSAQG